MAPGKLLVDTSFVVDFFHGDQTLARMLEQAHSVYVPVVVLAELLAGARRSQRVAENVRQVEDFVSRSVVLSCDQATASHYADIFNQLRARGKPIPENDMWIAAVATQHGFPIATRDAHFDEVESLQRVPC